MTVTDNGKIHILSYCTHKNTIKANKIKKIKQITQRKKGAH